MATKQEIIDTLTLAGIPHDPSAKKADLEALLPLTPAAPQAAPAPQPDQVPADDNGAATVYDMRGKPHRTYSLEVHGERYRELAEMFISDRPGWSLR